MLQKLHATAFVLLVSATEVYAQATAPASPGGTTVPDATPAAPPAATDDGSGVGWLLPLIALLVIGGLIWYFMKGRNRTSTAATGTSSYTETTANRTTGTTGSTNPSGDPTIRVYDDKKS